jgi:hypothetical protein
MEQPTPSAGDTIPPACEVIEVHVAELIQLFNEIDPTPFGERDLDARAEEFIVRWARDLPRHAPLALLVHLERPAGPPDESGKLRDAVQGFFRQRSEAVKRSLRQLFRRGRFSLVIGLTFLAAMLLLSELVTTFLGQRRLAALVTESLAIGGWVAMWGPLEVFLYDWWPIRAEARFFDRLAAMPVRIVYEGHAGADAWRHDWPASASHGGRLDTPTV